MTVDSKSADPKSATRPARSSATSTTESTATSTATSRSTTGASAKRDANLGATLALACALSLSALASAGCEGTREGAGGGAPSPQGFDPATCAPTITPGQQVVRRMTRFEYDNTLRDLLGDDTHPAAELGDEEEFLGFNNNAGALTTTTLLTEKYMLAAEGVSERATSPLSKVLSCDPTAQGGADEEPCIRAFLDEFGRRAFRRPLTQGEADAWYALYQAARDVELTNPDPEADPPRMGVRAVIEAALQSPHFLYRIELGSEVLPGGEGAGDVVKLSDWEMASRLSYFLWGSMPDEALFAAAEAGLLSTKEQIAAEARRMVKDPRAREALGEFHEQWLDFRRVASVGKDPVVFPEWSAAVSLAMREEARRFVTHVVFDAEGDLRTLLTARYTVASPELASFYGYASSAAPGSFETLPLEPTRHSGLLTLGALMSYNAHTKATSPVHRGKLVRELLLCETLDPPPPNIVINEPTVSPDATVREQLAAHREDPSCAGCHNLMDSIGFGFESFDAVGRFRALENGEPVDDTGAIAGSDVEGTFDGVVELGERLASSEQVRQCYVTQLFRWAYGRADGLDDQCALYELDEAFAASQGDVLELVVALTQTEAFLYRPAIELADAP